ncbi:MAG: hypothetical protein WCF23_12320 [Candidatus Nitrosopolaris sp.]
MMVCSVLVAVWHYEYHQVTEGIRKGRLAETIKTKERKNKKILKPF